MRFSDHTLPDPSNHIIIRSFHSTKQTMKIVFHEHHHTECELSILLAGRGVYSVHGKSYDFEVGDVFLFGSNEAHCVTEIDEPLEFLNIQFEPRILWEQSDSTELLNLFAARSKSFSHRFREASPVLRDLILGIERELAEQQPCCLIRVKYLLFSALVHMIRTYDCIDPDRGINAHVGITQSLSQSIRHINENLENKITLKEIADVACMTPTYFSSVFKKFNGISPWEYITIKRVERAIEMLKTTDMTKLEIAERCGFSSSSNFYKAFVAVTGKKPSDYSIL